MIAEGFIPDKTRTASLLNGFKNESFRKFIDENIFKIDLVWAVKSSRKYIENGKRALSHIKTLIKHVFLLFYLHKLLMSFWSINKIHVPLNDAADLHFHLTIMHTPTLKPIEICFGIIARLWHASGKFTNKANLHTLCSKTLQ